MPLLTLRSLPVGVLVVALVGCASPRPAMESNLPVQASAPAIAPEDVPVVRQGRYTLVEVAPRADQRDLLAQIIEISIPSTANATVGDGVRHILLRSGYRLCTQGGDFAALLALPLPAAHLQLGPLLLRDALVTLAGPAWTLDVDALTREVCFSHAQPASPAGLPPSSPAAPFPVASPAPATNSPL